MSILDRTQFHYVLVDESYGVTTSNDYVDSLQSTIHINVDSRPVGMDHHL